MRRGESQGRWNSRNPLCTLRKIQYFTYTKNGNSLSLLEVAWEAEMVPLSVWEIPTCVHAPNSLWHEENSFPSKTWALCSGREIGSTIASELSAFKVGRRLIRAFTQLRRRHYFSKITLLLLSPTLPAHTVQKTYNPAGGGNGTAFFPGTKTLFLKSKTGEACPVAFYHVKGTLPSAHPPPSLSGLY